MRAPGSVQYSSWPASQKPPDRLPRLLPTAFAAGRPAWLTTSPGTGQHCQAA